LFLALNITKKPFVCQVSALLIQQFSLRGFLKFGHARSGALLHDHANLLSASTLEFCLRQTPRLGAAAVRAQGTGEA
jgi:hypothetical protein